MGHVYKGREVQLTSTSFRLSRIVPVGGYALQPTWADGHNTGLYSLDYLRALGRGSQQAS